VIVCKDCGNKNQNGTTFCEACGTFLEWGGESVLTGAHQAIPSPDAPVEGSTPLAPPPAAAPVEPIPAAPPPVVETSPVPEAPEPAEQQSPAFQAQRLPVIASPDAGEPLAPATPPPAEPIPAAPPPVTEAPPAPDEPKAPAAARPGTQVLRAMRMKARPPAPPAAPPEGPTARPPAEEHERRPPKPPSAEPVRPQSNPGDIFCSSCGTPNDPSRHYCRSCGAPLGAAVAGEVVTTRRAPWWKRILGRGGGAGTPVPAGTRPAAGARGGAGRSAVGAGGNAINSVAHVARRFFQVIALLGALGIAVVAIGPWRSHAKTKVRSWLDDVRELVQPHYVKVTPTKITASSSLKDNPPQNAFDGIIESFWAEGAHGDGTGQSLTVTFAKATDLARVGFTVGDQKIPQAFATRPVPRTLTLVFYDADGAVVKREQVSLEQTPKFQKRDADAKGVTRLVITIASTYPPVKGAKSSASIAEIELFKKD
jgi:hypothetical protein